MRVEKKINNNVAVCTAGNSQELIERIKKNEIFDFSLSYDIQHLYPKEYDVGLKALQYVKEDLKIIFPKAEATAIAMHFINAREVSSQNISKRVILIIL